jgi:kynureninase
MAAVDVGIGLIAEAGIERLAVKGRALCELMSALGKAWLTPHGVTLASPRDPARRGSHLTFAHPQAWQLTQALIDRLVVPDFRTPDRVRLGPAPLYTRFVDIWDAMARFRDVLETGAHEGYPAERARVT